MKLVIEYHRSGATWWAESPNLKRWTGVGYSAEEVREVAHEALRVWLGLKDMKGIDMEERWG